MRFNFYLWRTCWPWFGDDPEKLGRPAHGFVRNLLWRLEKTERLEDGSTRVILVLTESKNTLKLWPHAFKLRLTIVVGRTLSLSLTTKNTGKNTFKVTQALHTYFYIGDINQTTVSGLDKINYLDKTKNFQVFLQQGDVNVENEVDRVYQNAPKQTLLIDNNYNRTIKIESFKSKTTVIWNPWKAISIEKDDFEDDDYHRFICVETANAFNDFFEIAPNNSHTMGVRYSID